MWLYLLLSTLSVVLLLAQLVRWTEPAADMERHLWLLGRRLHITFERRPHRVYMSRFGGGWAWEVGIQVGMRGTVIVCWLVGYSRIDWKPKGWDPRLTTPAGRNDQDE